MHVTVWARGRGRLPPQTPLPRSSPHRGVGEVDRRPVRRGPQAVRMSLRLVSWFSCIAASPLMRRNGRRVWALGQDPSVAGREHCIGELTERLSQRPGESVCPAQASLPASSPLLCPPRDFLAGFSWARAATRRWVCGLRFSSVPRWPGLGAWPFSAAQLLVGSPDVWGHVC